MAKKRKTTAKQKKKINYLICLFILVIIALVGYFGKDYIFNLSNNNTSESVSNNEHSSSHSESDSISNSTELTYDELKIYFLELGSYNTGDSTYIKYKDIDILIDAGAVMASSETIKEFVNQHCLDGKLEYVITTHAHTDHYSGMFGNKKASTNFKNESVERTGILYYYEVGTLIDFALTNQAETAAYYTNYKNAVEYAVSKGTVHYTAAECFNEENGAQREYVIDASNNITLEILYNYYYTNRSSDENNYSVCTMLNYNDHHFMFTGDLEKDGEERLAAYYDKSTFEKTLPHVDVFKAGHHGSKTSSNDCLLSLITPDICCVCCCAGGSEYTTNYLNAFPTQDFIDRISQYTEKVYVTSVIDEEESRAAGKLTQKSLNGNICVSCNGLEVTITASNNDTILKDSEWFNQTIYIDANDNICSGNKGSTAFYTESDEGVRAVQRRTWL